jgi:hypothetical protein
MQKNKLFFYHYQRSELRMSQRGKKYSFSLHDSVESQSKSSFISGGGGSGGGWSRRPTTMSVGGGGQPSTVYRGGDWSRQPSTASVDVDGSGGQPSTVHRGGGWSRQPSTASVGSGHPSTARPHLQHRQPNQEHPPRNPDNLFAQLLRLGREIRIPENVLIDYLKLYTTQPGIAEIAEKPTKPDVTFGYEEMVREISPGAVKFRQVLEQGFSADSMGVNEFKQFMQHNPPSGYIWAFNKCPYLGNIQQEICTSQSDRLSDICCFVEGFIFNPNGSISFFKARNISGSQYMHEKQAFIWITNVGNFIVPGYRGTNGYLFINEKRKEDPLYGVPSRIDQVIVHHDKRILANPIYRSNCQTAMAKIGGIPISIDFSEQQEEAAEAVPTFSELQVQQATRDCKHGIWGGGEVLGKCGKCDWGEN